MQQQAIIYKNIDNILKPHLIINFPKDKVYPEWFDSFSFKLIDQEDINRAINKALLISNEEVALKYVTQTPIPNEIYKVNNITWEYIGNDMSKIKIMDKCRFDCDVSHEIGKQTCECFGWFYHNK